MTPSEQKIQQLLYKVNKPSHYSGGEIKSYNKDFDTAKVKIALAFPDKYEVGVSNLGHRVLYECVNSVEKFYGLGCSKVSIPTNNSITYYDYIEREWSKK